MASRNTQLSARTLRQFGWLVAGCLALTGHLIGASPAALFLQLCGAVMFAVSTVRPRALTGLYWLATCAVWPLLWLCGRTESTLSSDGEAAALPRRPRRLRPRKRPATS
jgi:hypothetical protein